MFVVCSSCCFYGSLYRTCTLSLDNVSNVSVRLYVESSAEAEYVDECNAVKEMIFLIQALKEMRYEGLNTNSIIILTDNQAAIKMASNPVNHPPKHIYTSYHYVRNKVEEGAIRLKYIFINQMIVDGLTKPLEPGKFQRFRSVMGLASGK